MVSAGQGFFWIILCESQSGDDSHEYLAKLWRRARYESD
jgi:hypothetical protein